MLKSVPIISLVEDFELYPRHNIDNNVITDLVDALKSGVQLPPIIAEKKSLRIVDGIHRRRAYLRYLGKTASINVDLQEYRQEADLFSTAVELNAQHGRRLDRQDRTKCSLKLLDYGFDNKAIARILHTTPKRVQVLTTKVAVVQGERRAVKPIISKIGEGIDITPEQYDVAQSSSGWSMAQTVKQLIREIEVGLVPTDPDLYQLFRILRAAIDTILERIEGA